MKATIDPEIQERTVFLSMTESEARTLMSFVGLGSIRTYAAFIDASNNPKLDAVPVQRVGGLLYRALDEVV